MEQSRYYAYSKTRLPKRKKTIRLEGSFDDRGKYIRCWNCGFIVDTSRDLGNPERDGNYQSTVTIDRPSTVMTGEVKPITPVMFQWNSIGVVIQHNPDGTPVTTDPESMTHYLAEVARGCPLCGVTNL